MKLDRAVAAILCHGDAQHLELERVRAGLLSQLNHLLDALLIRVYAGVRPAALDEIYGRRLSSYGNASLGSIFEPLACADGGRHDVEAARLALRRAPRAHVVSQLMHTLLRPRNFARVERYDVAVHVRRGDKLADGRTQERVAVWNATRIAAAAADLAVAPRRRRTRKLPASVLLASDDNAFSAEVERILVDTHALRVTRLSNEFDRGAESPMDACETHAACIAPMLAVPAAFARARALVLSTKSNVGTYALSWYPAANQGRLPRALVDMDGAVSLRGLRGGELYFCQLQWGARCGLCEQWWNSCGGGRKVVVHQARQ